jgi:hypothetical protein
LNVFAERTVYRDENDAYLVGAIANGDAGAVRPLLAWLPSPEGLSTSRQALREALGIVVQKLAH